MATILLPPDFKEFLKLLNSERIEYLLVGGYAVGYRSTTWSNYRKRTTANV